MNKKSILSLIVTSIVLSGCASLEKIDVSDPVSGTFKNIHGATIEIETASGVNEFRIKAKDFGDSLWNGIGFYNPKCHCITSVFQYSSHKEKYGDSVGFHRFTFTKNYEGLIKKGGWKQLNEFGDKKYTRIK